MCLGVLMRSHWRWGFLCLTARKNSSSASQSLWEVCCFACQPSNRRTVRIGLSRFFFSLGFPVIPKRLGWCMFCLTDDHFIMRMLFGTLQVYMLLVYFKRNQPVDSSRDLFIPRSLSIVEGSPTTFESRSREFTHSPSPKKVTMFAELPGRWDFLRMFFPRCGFPKIFNATQRQTPGVFWCDLRSSKRGEISGWIYHHPPPKDPGFQDGLKNEGLDINVTSSWWGGGIFWNYPPT